jgi:hypothetical protein
MTSRATVTVNRLAAQMTPEQTNRYGALVQAVIGHAAAFTRNGQSADEAAKVIARAVTARKPRTRYTIGRDAALLARLSRILPDRARSIASSPLTCVDTFRPMRRPEARGAVPGTRLDRRRTGLTVLGALPK